MSFLSKWFGLRNRQPSQRPARSLSVERLEAREVLSASPLPVLLVIADKQDFYFKEYNDTRIALESKGINVVVAATTTDLSTPHAGSGQAEAGVSGVVKPDIALANVNPADYSAIAFVGGWGSSMYQYAYNDPNGDGVTDNLYFNAAYNGDTNLNDGVIAPQKVIVNQLIGSFLADDKPVAAICHGVTVLAWARVDGVSPLAGRQVSVPLTVGSPNQHFNGADRFYPYSSGQYDQVVANGGIANTVSGQYGPSAGAEDDVVVDGRIITAENYDSATAFGLTIAHEVIASLAPVNQPPVAEGFSVTLAENTAYGTVVGTVAASDPDVGQSLSYSIVSGNTNGAFALDAATGLLRVATPAALDFETNPTFQLMIRVADNGSPSAETFAVVNVQLTDVFEPVSLVAGNLQVLGTAGDDVIYAWSNAGGSVSVWLNGTNYGPFNLGPGGRLIVHAGNGNDRIAVTDLYVSAALYGEGGNDQITGGAMSDFISGGDGVDRLWGGLGNDVISGDAGNDYLFGREGNDVLSGGDGDDYLEGLSGRDLLLGGLGVDTMCGGEGQDVLIGGRTAFDSGAELKKLAGLWFSPTLAPGGLPLQIGQTVFDDGVRDVLYGGTEEDWYFSFALDELYSVSLEDHVLS